MSLNGRRRTSRGVVFRRRPSPFSGPPVAPRRYYCPTDNPSESDAQQRKNEKKFGADMNVMH
jgi:hypothetical protein